ncbi:hypothetical protein KCU78_g4873, partial [Aureobasidium melanogenum]
MGLVSCGSSLRGVFLPIMFNRRIVEIGFPWAMRVCAFLILVLLIFANLTIVSRLPPSPAPLAFKGFIKPFTERAYVMTVASAFLYFLGLFVPINYIAAHSENATKRRHAVDGNLKGYTHVCSADFQNAFNSVSRKAVSAATIMYAPEFYKPAKWAYDEPSALVMYDGTVITSSEGTGLKALGSSVGPLDGRKEFLQGKIEELQQVLERLQDLPKQHALLLLRAKGLQNELQDIDRRLLQTVKYLQGSYNSKPLDQDLVALPARLGGLGITLFEETAHLAFQNSKAIADLTLQKILTPKLFWRLPREFSPSPTRSVPEDDLQQDQYDVQQDQDDLQQDQDDLQQDSDNLQQDPDGMQQDQDNLQQPRGRSKTRATETQQQSLAYFLTQNVQKEPEPLPRHQSTNAVGTGLARTIYRTAMDKLHKARLTRLLPWKKMALRPTDLTTPTPGRHGHSRSPINPSTYYPGG